MVLTPGATIASTHLQNLADNMPAAAHFFDLAGRLTDDRHSRLPSTLPPSSSSGRQIAVHVQQPPALAIIIHQGKRLPFIGLQAFNDHVFTVILPRFQSAPSTSQTLGDTRWLKVNVIDSPTGRTGSTSGKPLQETIILHRKLNHNRRLRQEELVFHQDTGRATPPG